MIVPPGTAASAAALTFSAVVPVSNVSPGPFVIVEGSGRRELHPRRRLLPTRRRSS
jgi:hypothetical protein